MRSALAGKSMWNRLPCDKWNCSLSFSIYWTSTSRTCCWAKWPNWDRLRWTAAAESRSSWTMWLRWTPKRSRSWMHSRSNSLRHSYEMAECKREHIYASNGIHTVCMQWTFTYGLFSDCETAIPMKTTKHMNVLYLSMRSCSCKYDSSHLVLRNRSRIVDILLLNDDPSFSASLDIESRRFENKWLKLVTFSTAAGSKISALYYSRLAYRAQFIGNRILASLTEIYQSASGPTRVPSRNSFVSWYAYTVPWTIAWNFFRYVCFSILGQRTAYSTM